MTIKWPTMPPRSAPLPHTFNMPTWQPVKYIRLYLVDGSRHEVQPHVQDYLLIEQNGTRLWSIEQLYQQIDVAERDLTTVRDELAGTKLQRDELRREATALRDHIAEREYAINGANAEIDGWRQAVVKRDIELRALKTRIGELEKAPHISDKERNGFHDVIGALTKERDGWRKEALDGRKERAELWKTDRSRDTVLRDQANFREERDAAIAQLGEVKRRLLVGLTTAPATLSEEERQIRRKVFDELWPQITLEKL